MVIALGRASRDQGAPEPVLWAIICRGLSDVHWLFYRRLSKFSQESGIDRLPDSSFSLYLQKTRHY